MLIALDSIATIAFTVVVGDQRHERYVLPRTAKPPSNDPGYRRVLWVVLAINAAMFVAELLLGFAAGSVSLAGGRPRFPR